MAQNIEAPPKKKSDTEGECWDCGKVRKLTKRGQCAQCFNLDNN